MGKSSGKELGQHRCRKGISRRSRRFVQRVGSGREYKNLFDQVV